MLGNRSSANVIHAGIGPKDDINLKAKTLVHIKNENLGTHWKKFSFGQKAGGFKSERSPRRKCPENIFKCHMNILLRERKMKERED